MPRSRKPTAAETEILLPAQRAARRLREIQSYGYDLVSSSGGERVGSSGGGYSDPANRWLAAMSRRESLDSEREACLRSVMYAMRYIGGLRKAMGDLPAAMLTNHFMLDKTWEEAAAMCGVPTATGFRRAVAALEWCDSVGVAHVMAGLGRAEE